MFLKPLKLSKVLLCASGIVLLVLLGILIPQKSASSQEMDALGSPKSFVYLQSRLIVPEFYSENPFKNYAYYRTNEWECLNTLWEKESGWDPGAQNPISTAYGIAQFLDSTWAGTEIAKTSDAYLQIDAGLIYINRRYGSPCQSLNFHYINNYY